MMHEFKTSHPVTKDFKIPELSHELEKVKSDENQCIWLEK